MIHVTDGIAGLSLYRHEERHYLRYSELDMETLVRWYGPLSDMEYNAFMRLSKAKECDEPK